MSLRAKRSNLHIATGRLLRHCAPRYDIVAPILLILFLSACSPAPTPVAPISTPSPRPSPAPTETLTSEPTPDPRVQIRFWHSQPQSAIAPLIDKFNSTNSDINVVAVQSTNIDLVKNVTASLGSDTRPDVILAYPIDLAQFSKSGALVPLDDPKLGFSADDLKDFFPAFVDRYPQFGNKIYSLGLSRHMQVMYYNADLLKYANIGKPPETWDEFIKACAALNKPPDIICFELDPNALDFELSVLGRAGGLLTGDAKRVTFDQKQGLDTLTWISDLFRGKYAILATRAFQEQSDFASGKLAFTFDTTLALPAYDKQIKNAGKNFAWGIAVPPRTATPIVMAYGPSLAIVNASPEKQRAAFTFVKALLSSEYNGAWAIATNSFPARQSAKDNLADYIKSAPPYGQAFNWLRFARAEPNVAVWASIRPIIADAMLSVAAGKAQPADALKDAATKANAALGQ